MSGRRVLAEIGRDQDALCEEDRGALLFDLGLGTLQLDACVRTGDVALIVELRRWVGQSLFAPGNGAMTAIFAVNPHRVFLSRVRRVEVFQPIPPPDGKSPDGPHTHVLPRLLRHNRTHATTESLPQGWIPSAHFYPPHPARDALGQWHAFRRDRHTAFQELLGRYGDQHVIDVKRRVEEAVVAGKPPSCIATPADRFARATVRITLRQLRASAPNSPVLPTWLSVHDHLSRMSLMIQSESTHARADRTAGIDDDALERRQAIGERGWPGLKDKHGFDFVEPAASNCRNGVESGANDDLFFVELLPAPGPDNDIRRASDHGIGCDDTILGRLAPGKLGKDIDTAGDRDQLGDPGDAGNHRIIPFLKIDFRTITARFAPSPGAVEIGRKPLGQYVGALSRANDSAERAYHIKDPGDRALIERMNGNACADECSNNIRLQVGECKNEVRFESEDFGNIGRDECRDTRLLLARLRWPDGVARNADDAVLFAKQIECLGGFLGQADDSLRRIHPRPLSAPQPPKAVATQDLSAPRHISERKARRARLR
jgi:hypothetical protein